MNTGNRLTIAFLIAFSTGIGNAALAQDSLVGTYSGRMTTPQSNGPATTAIELTISQLEGGVVTAALKRYGNRSCTTSMTGELKEQQLELKSNADAQLGCKFEIKLSRDGNKLTGTANANPLELSK